MTLFETPSFFFTFRTPHEFNSLVLMLTRTLLRILVVDDTGDSYAYMMSMKVSTTMVYWYTAFGKNDMGDDNR